jgi:hypothetical protein
MTNPFRICLLALPLLLGACVHPLEQIVDANRQARIEAANANRSLTRGASDGLGTYIAKSQDDGPDVKPQR